MFSLDKRLVESIGGWHGGAEERTARKFLREAVKLDEFTGGCCGGPATA